MNAQGQFSAPVTPLAATEFAALDQHIEQQAGFQLLSFPEADLTALRQRVMEQYLHVLQCQCPAQVQQYRDAGMAQYHQVYRPEHFDHGQVWGKPARVLGPLAVAEIQQLSFWQELKRLFGDFLVADEEHFGWPGIYWRLVRPGGSDVGPIHADKWFWDLGHGTMPQGYQRLKCWLPLYAEVGKSGLRVVPQSQQREDWRFHGELKGGQMKPVIDEPEDELDLQLLPLAPGQLVLFHDKLLHGGMPNMGSTSRVSLEFTLLIPEAQYAK